MLDLHYHFGGLFLPRLALWLDAHHAVTGPERVFVSHAHADHTARHREVILSAPTAKLMRARLGGERVEHVLAFGQAREFGAAMGAFRLTLLPAGHVLGSAMAWIEADGESLLYTGDFKLRSGLAAEPCEPREADVLVMETTYGRPHYRFPPTADVIEGVIRFCHETIAEGQTAVLLGYSLGKSQELLIRLRDAGLPLVLHQQVHRLTAVYEACGIRFPAYERFAPGISAGKVVVCPPQVATPPWLRKLGPFRIAWLSGWAVDDVARFRWRADAAFPLSDHADFDDLLRLVELVRPRRVLTLHGFAADFARVLRERGYDARALGEIEQLELGLGVPDARAGQGSGVARPAVTCSAGSPQATAVLSQPPGARDGAEAFGRFALACARIAASSERRGKLEHLVRYLREAPVEWLPSVVIWLSGQPFASVEDRWLRVGVAALRTALCAAMGVTEEAFRYEYLLHGDMGETAAALWPVSRAASTPLQLAEVARFFEATAAAHGPGTKLALLCGILERCVASEAKYLVKLVTGDLRLGLKEGLVEEAIAEAFGAEAALVQRCALLRSHLGEVAEFARRGELQRAGLVPFRLVEPMLASPEPTAEAAWARMQLEAHLTAPVWVEDNLDGLRGQLHRVGQRAALFSSEGENLAAAFPELVEAALRLPADVILDGEILAMRGGQVLPFAELQQRLGRRDGDLRFSEEVPVAFVSFDLLWHEGVLLLDEPLAVRRRRLEALSPLPEGIHVRHLTYASSASDLSRALDAARSLGHQGLVLKDPRSPYTPGRRGLAWLELSGPAGTLDPMAPLAMPAARVGSP